MEQYAYIRVSTKEQNVERQIFALDRIIFPRKIFIVIISLGKILSVRRIRNY